MMRLGLVIICILTLCQTFPIRAFGATDTVKTLVIFAKFPSDSFENYKTTEWPHGLNDTLPDWADTVISADSSAMIEGTITYYYHQMSGGKYLVMGDVYEKVFIPDSAESWYAASQGRGYGYLNRIILDSLDEYIDYSDYDSDHDGYVDYLAIVYRLWDANSGTFIGEPGATGKPSLGMSSDYYSSQDNISIKSTYGGTQYATAKGLCNGTIEHEMGHNLHWFGTTLYNLPDLYDKSPSQTTADSKGPGAYALMASGNFSKYEIYREAPMCVWTLIKEGWKTPTVVDGWKRNYELDHIQTRNGQVVKLPISTTEYFLAVNRQDNNYYNAYNPGRGMLIWHIDDNVGNNWNELHKKTDVECADGLWKDHGWSVDDPPDTANVISGRDNMDFWHYDASICSTYYGNNGDATDWFDGVTYTSFSEATNPSSHGYNGNDQNVSSNIAILNIRKKSGVDSIMVADFYTNNWTGYISSNTTWSDSIHVSGDIFIDSGVTLTINAGTKIIIEPNFDDQNAGATTDIEFVVNGSLIINGTSSDTVLITSCADTPAAQDWYGIRNYGIVDIEYCNIKYARTPIRNYVGSCKSTIDHCVLDSFYNYGVQATTGSLSVKNTLICNPTYSSARGLSLGTANLTYLEVKDNTIKGFTGASNLYGIFLGTASLNTTISGNKLSGFSSGSNRYGIYLSYSDSITLSKNIIDGVSSFTKGIYLSGCDYCVIDDNAISYCTSRGIECYNSNTVNVYDNLLFDNGSSAYAIYMNGSSTSGDIDNNHICAENESYSCFMGICAYASAIGNVHNNTIEDFTDIGISTGSYGDSLFCGSSASHGNNNIYWNFDDKGSSTGDLLILSESASTTPAEYNYFGSSPSAANFYYLVNWSNYLSFPASDIMVGYYKMNTGSGSTADDECLLNNDGTISGASWVSRTPGYALDFDGVNDYVNISDSDVSNIFNNSSDFTIIAWVNPDSFPISGTTIDGASIVGQHYATSMVFGVRSDGKLFLSMDDTGVSSPKSSTALSKNQWQQVAVSYDNATDSCYFYIDGDGAGKGLIADYTIGVHDYLYIGWQGRSDPSYRPGYFNGGIDEVRIYNHVLEADEINALYDDIECVATKPVMPQITPVVPNPIVDPEMLVKVVPNPFTSLTELTFYVPKASVVKSNVALRIYNQAGELINEIMSASVVNGRSYQIKWDGSLENGDKAREGIYHYEYSADDKMVTGSIMLVK